MTMKQPKKVLFIDLDGTLIETISGSTFPKDTHDWKFKEGIITAIANYCPDVVHIVTNQGGIQKGFVDELEFVKKLQDIQLQFIAQTCICITYDYCIYNEPFCVNRKPNPGMINNFFDSVINHIKVRDCLMVGDASGKPGDFSSSDKNCALNAHVSYMDVEDFIKQYNTDYVSNNN